MATPTGPNPTPNPNQPAKPGVPATGAPKPAVPNTAAGVPKPAAPGVPKPAAPGVPKPGAPAAGATPKPAGAPAPASAPKPGAPAPRPAGSPPAAGAPKPAPKPAPPPQKPKNRFAHIDSNTKQLGQKLLDLGFLEESALEATYEEMKTSEERLSEILIGKGLLTDDQLLQATAEIHGMKVANLEEVKPSKEAVAKVPKIMAEQYKLVPISFEANTLTVAMSDPNNMHAVEDIRNFLGISTVQAMLAPPKQIDVLFDKAYNTAVSAGGEDSILTILAQIEADPELGANTMRRETSIDIAGIEEMANSAPVRKLINMVLLMAIRDHASDIHFEPFEDEYKMRYRCDGVLYEMVPPPRHLATAIASRIKVMSNLDIAERRLPQDGRIELNVGGNPIDMRVSVLPTMFGESVCVRVLDRSNVGLSLDRIGMQAELLAKFRQVIKKPNGIVFVTGPTGAGKTTTLYSALSELNEITDKI
ncbi:MAG: ATPase, T2SS/T4P/T4SS family, partial [Gemmataceae bacterium]